MKAIQPHQRPILSNTALTLSLTILAVTVSLTLIIAAAFMVKQLLIPDLLVPNSWMGFYSV